MTLLHATAIAINGRAVLLEGPSGSGKSDLALRLIDRGARLISDDYVEVTAREKALLASPPQEIAGKLEIRGIGIVEVDPCRDVPVALIIELVDREQVPRLPESRVRILDGIRIPASSLHAFDASAPIKVGLLLERS